MDKWKKLFRFPDSRGFTLFEIIVVATIITFVSVTLVKSLSSFSRVKLERVADVMVSDIRLAQQLTLSSHQFKGTGDPTPRIRCGYGITQSFQGSTGYLIYAGAPTIRPNGNPQNCPNDKNYQPSANKDSPYKVVTLDYRVDLVTSVDGFRDIFFEPPGPTTYINNSNSTPVSQKITIKKRGLTANNCKDGSTGCIYICVYLSGRVEISKNYFCPSPIEGTAPPTPTPTPTSTSIPIGCNGGIDVGLRLFQDGIRRVAVEPGSPTSPLRIYQNVIRGVVLVPVSDPNASRMRIQTPAGIRAFCIFP